MSCKNCKCNKCNPPKKSKQVTVKELQKSARYSYAIGSLWKKIAQDFDEQAKNLEGK